MRQQTPAISNINEYHEHLRLNISQIKNQPATNRNCNDKCCYVFFMFLTLLLIGGGLFFIIAADFGKFTHSTTNGKNSTPITTEISAYDISNLKSGIPVIIGMIVLSIVLAVAFQCLLLKFPKCMFYTMLILGGVFMIVLAIIMIYAGVIAGGVIFGLITIIYFIVVFCNQNQIRIGTVLLETAARFILQKPSVFIVPFIMLLIILAFEVFWLASLIGITMYSGDSLAQQQNSSKQTISSIFAIIWMFLQLFYSFFFHYCTVFLIATAAAIWYYNVSSNFICTGLKRIIFNHLGSFTFAAMIMAIISSARKNAQDRSSGSQGCAACCLCIVACILKGIEDLLDVLNHNAVIVMSVTGQNYIDSAKSTISLIFQNFSLFLIIDVVSGFLKFGGILFICGIPGITGYFLLQATSDNPDDKNFLLFGTVIIVLVSMLIAGIFLNILSQALSCVFIFFCLDKKLHYYGSPAPMNVPKTMRQLFNQLNTTANSFQPINGNQNVSNNNNNPYGSSNLYQNPRVTNNRNTPQRSSGYPSLN